MSVMCMLCMYAMSVGSECIYGIYVCTLFCAMCVYVAYVCMVFMYATRVCSVICVSM